MTKKASGYKLKRTASGSRNSEFLYSDIKDTYSNNTGIDSRLNHNTKPTIEPGRYLFTIINTSIFLFAFLDTIRVNSSLNDFKEIRRMMKFTAIICAPFYGHFGDVFGPRCSLILAYVAAAFFCTLQIFSYDNFTEFTFILMNVSSLFMYVVPASQIMISSYSDHWERTRRLSLLTCFYTIGNVSGLIFQRFVVQKYAWHSSKIVACFCSWLSLILIFCAKTTVVKIDQNIERSKFNVFNLKQMFSVFLLPGVISLFLFKVIVGLSMGIFQTFTLNNAKFRFHFNSSESDYLGYYTAGLLMIMQGLILPALIKRFPDKMLIKFAVVLLGLSYLIMIKINSAWEFFLVIFPITCSYCLISTILTSAVSARGIHDFNNHTGSLLGFNLAVHGFIQNVATSIESQLMRNCGFEAIAILGAVFSFVALFIVNLRSSGFDDFVYPQLKNKKITNIKG